MSSNNISKSFIFFKNLFRPHSYLPPKDKKLRIYHKLWIAFVLRSRKMKDIPDTISYFEWNHIKDRSTFAIFVLCVLSPVFSGATLGKYLYGSQTKQIENIELKKFGEIQVRKT